MTFANRRFNVAVSAADIESGIPENSSVCAVAQAVARTIPEATRVKVDAQAIRFTHDETRYVYLTPDPVYQYIVAFDAGDPIEPFRFQIRDPFEFVTRRKTEGKKAAERARYAGAKKAREAGKSDQAVTAAGTAAYKAHRAAADGPAFTAAGSGSKKRTNPVPIKNPNIGRERNYGHRLMRINVDRFATN